MQKRFLKFKHGHSFYMLLNKIRRKISKYQLGLLSIIFYFIYKKYKINIYVINKGVITQVGDNDIDYLLSTGTTSDAIHLMSSIEHLIGDAKISLDVGANIGVFSVWLSQFSDFVHAFEPAPNNILEFKETIRNNKVKNVLLHECAVGEKNETITLNISECSGHHTVASKHLSKFIAVHRVEMITIDHFCLKHSLAHVDILKIDVEGYEKEVLEGCKNMLEKKSIKLIIFEHSKILLNVNNKSIYQVYDLLMDADYSIYNISGETLYRKDIVEILQGDFYARPN